MRFLIVIIFILSCKTRQFGSQPNVTLASNTSAFPINPKERYLELVTRSFRAAQSSKNPAEFEFAEGHVLLKKMHFELSKALERIEIETPEKKSPAYYDKADNIDQSISYIYKNKKLIKTT